MYIFCLFHNYYELITVSTSLCNNNTPVRIKKNLLSMCRLFLFSKVTVHCNLYVPSNIRIRIKCHYDTDI